MVTTGAAIGVDVVRGAEPAAELTEVPLMAAMFVAMVWHARRKLAAEQQSHPVSEENARLLASVWGYDFDPGSNVVDVCVRRLRSKLGFDLIKTVRGAGYRLAS